MKKFNLCPRCGSDQIEDIEDEPEDDDYAPDAEVFCVCGWEGCADDLVSDEGEA